MNLIERAVARLGSAQRPAALDPVRKSDPSPVDADAQAEGVAVEELDRIRPVAPEARAGTPPVPPAPRFGKPVELPLARMREQGFLIPTARATATGHEFRLIKSPLMDKAFGTEAQRVPRGERIAVTSALPGEGKTFCTINLAISVAATGDHSVLLVDADVSRPSVAHHLGIEPEGGLIDLLDGKQSDPFGLILPTNIERLSILPAGQSHAHAGEHLAGPVMPALLDRLSQALPGWLIIIDTPPLLAVTETRSLLQRVGQVVMVIAAGSTPRRSVDTALAGLTNVGDVSLVLNKASESAARIDYYYGY